ncbi:MULTISPECIES: ammonium transporter [unclassified Pseudomonas]|uniref:ammonium transporter n=1 Tax=unclassified Pseudomonas TaxID=196821 RepID=UPI000BCE3D7D|nr:MULTISPECIES: ammonium transporter [unclassified Pseudomonas]PVZ20077.1 Amt family ammonium transporter [Pseudomonas sp. URIL14HWK12:I12]PVZ27143.1 Amt family ammonium transporter [Pseudomonas sp. URIL14HWK12:I10]PVZ38032.1 Amt family ammonium transporter [Pseudomonas sp. URIL14HWK12:I11]SNZ04763.1 ammonium transporter (TC 1.A.11) [Pseudomonas sp. URIL14HWK12:I9]
MIKPLSGGLALMLSTRLAQAADPTPALDTGSSAWMITATALVLFMCVPGLALFYGGLVRAKNLLSLFTQCFGIAGLIGVLWVLYGYSLVVDTTGMVEGQVTLNSFIGSLSRAFLVGMTPESLVGTIPEGVFVTFQMTFAIITPALIAGAFAERMKFSAALLFMALWFTLVYAPIAHMVWGGAGALMHNWGVLDYAGGTAVHINAGVAALVAALMLGKRKGYPHTAMPPHNLCLAMVGAAMLWVGWFGFNIGSGGGLSGASGMVMINTQVGACAGIVGWMFTEWFKAGRVSALGLASGALAGLVGITPACAYVGVGGALAIGGLCGVGCYLAVTVLKQRLGYDDTLDVFGLHGVGGIIGAVLTGVFCVPELGGLVDGVSMASQVLAQVKGVAFTFGYCFVASWVILKAVKFITGLRAHEAVEEMGLDLGEHNERAYNH